MPRRLEDSVSDDIEGSGGHISGSGGQDQMTKKAAGAGVYSEIEEVAKRMMFRCLPVRSRLS